MEIDKLGEILRLYTDRLKYNSGFAAFKKNYVSNDYVNVRGDDAIFYGTVFDEHHRRSYTSMININTSTRTISNVKGNCFFRLGSLEENRLGFTDELKEFYEKNQ